ncbi:MAG: helix-turn-helix domain-containing protein [Geminicoccaceae bacterium]
MTTVRITDRDRAIGKRIADGRKLRTTSLYGLERQTGFTYQQISKYESGINRISASRLEVIANVLGLPITFFYDQSSEFDFPNSVRARGKFLEALYSLPKDQQDAIVTQVMALAKNVPASPPLNQD